MNEMDTICQYARELKLSSVRENLPLFAEDAVRELNKESALQGKWQVIHGFVDGKYASDWQHLHIR